MPIRRLPVRPDKEQLIQEASALLAAFQAREPNALADFREFLPEGEANLVDARHVLARAYQASDWTRLMQAVSLVDAIWEDDVAQVRDLITANPHLRDEMTIIRKDSNWGPPMTYAANLGRNDIIRTLHEMGATDLMTALDRAILQSHIETAVMLHKLLGAPPAPEGALGGPAYTLSTSGTAFALSVGARVHDDSGKMIAPVCVVLETDGRNPEAKHAILALYEKHGVAYPDTPTMALHRGRIDLLEAHLKRDPDLLRRTFTHREIYPLEMGCREEIDATVGTPLGGTSLLHMAIDYNEFEIAQWLLDKGMDPNIRSRVGSNGFGGYTPLFCTVVSQPNFWMNFHERGPFIAPFTELLLSHGADPNIRASLWKRLHPGHGDPVRHEYRDVTPLGWGTQFHARIFVSKPAMDRIAAAGGVA